MKTSPYITTKPVDMDDIKQAADDHDQQQLHVVMFPWLAMGHIIPYFQLSKCLARKGLRISFASTPRNLQRLPRIPPNLSSLINLVSLPLMHDPADVVDDNLLPENAEATIDVPIEKTEYLKKAFDGLESSLTSFLEKSKPDWIIHDFASHWLPGIAAKLGVPSVFFSIFFASSLAFHGPPSAWLSNEMSVEDLTTVPKWIPFPSDIVYRFYELSRFTEAVAPPPQGNIGSASMVQRFGEVIRDSKFVAIRGCVEFESEWLGLLNVLYEKPVIPVGSLPPTAEDLTSDENNDDQGENPDASNWVLIKEWLDKQRIGSVVYIALGSEATLSREQVNEIAMGLELSELPFFWVLRKPPAPPTGSTQGKLMTNTLPEGFEERTRGRGVVYKSWAPQVRILAHPSVGGFLTHCGVSSAIEALSFGRVLILLPMLNDQPLIARFLQGKKVGLEIPRDEDDGSFTGALVAKLLRVVMVEKEGEVYRNKAREMREVFGNEKLHDSYVNNFVQYLQEHKNL